MQSVQVVVHSDPRHGHGISDILDGTTKNEGSSFVEKTNGSLLVLATHLSQATSQLVFDTLDQAIQRTVKCRPANTDDELAAELDGNIGWFHVLTSHECAPECIDQRSQHLDDLPVQR